MKNTVDNCSYSYPAENNSSIADAKEASLQQIVLTEQSNTACAYESDGQEFTQNERELSRLADKVWGDPDKDIMDFIISNNLITKVRNVVPVSYYDIIKNNPEYADEDTDSIKTENSGETKTPKISILNARGFGGTIPFAISYDGYTYEFINDYTIFSNKYLEKHVEEIRENPELVLFFINWMGGIVLYRRTPVSTDSQHKQ